MSTYPDRMSELRASPALFPLAIDPWLDSVEFVRLDKKKYEENSFLDQRMNLQGSSKLWLPWREVRAAAIGLPSRCHFIFHISHVGSTLLSRLLGARPAFLSLREPGVLRYLADEQLSLGRPGSAWSDADFTSRLEVFLALFSRTFDAAETPVLKATSFAAEMAAELLRLVESSRAILMYVRPVVFLRALLGGVMDDIESRAARRLYRLHRRLGRELWRLEAMSPGERVAMTWLCEMLSLSAAAERCPNRVHWLDFDQFLATPEPLLAACMEHFGAGAPAAEVAQLLRGPIMRRYSKAPQFEFDAGSREQLLQQADSRYATEILRGMGWLHHSASTIPECAKLPEALG